MTRLYQKHLPSALNYKSKYAVRCLDDSAYSSSLRDNLQKENYMQFLGSLLGKIQEQWFSVIVVSFINTTYEYYEL